MFVSIEKAAQILKKGQLVAVPTETVYGLAGSIHYPEAIESIYNLKNRPKKNPLIVHFADLESVLEYVRIAPFLLPELTHLWPGPLTIVAPLKKQVPSYVTSGLSTLAVRIPQHPTFLELIRQVGPLAAPSANLSGLPSTTRPWHIETDYGIDFPVAEGDFPVFGLESTVLIQKENHLEIGRLGATPLEHLSKIFAIQPGDNTLNCPGKLFKHYSPDCPLTTSLDSSVEAIVGFEDACYAIERPLYNLGPKNDPLCIANNLFETLRKLDRDQIKKAYIDTSFPDHGLYQTIHERLARALTTQS